MFPTRNSLKIISQGYTEPNIILAYIGIYKIYGFAQLFTSTILSM